MEHYFRLDPSDKFMLTFAAPPETAPKLEKFLSDLRAGNVLEGLSHLIPLTFYRYHPIREAWNPPPEEAVISGPMQYLPDARKMEEPRMDYKDLLMLTALKERPDADLEKLLELLHHFAENGYDMIKPHLSASVSDWYYHLKKSARYVEAYPMHLSRGDPR